MKSLMLREIIAPLATRVGTALSGYLIGVFSADPSLTHEVGTVFAAVVLVTVDLITSSLARRNREGE